MGMDSINAEMRPLTEDEKQWCLKHQGIARRLTIKYSQKTFHDYDDIFQVVNMAMMKAATKYDPEKGAPSTYIYRWATAYIKRFLPPRDDGMKRPEYVKTALHAMHKWIGYFFTLNQRLPDEKEKDDWLREKCPRLSEISRKEVIRDTVTVNAILFDGDGEEVDITNWIPDDGEKPDDAFLRRECEYSIREALKKLMRRELDMLTAYYGIDREKETLQEIGDRHGLSRERVRQINQAVMSKLKMKIKDVEACTVHRFPDNKSITHQGRAKIVKINPYLLEDYEKNGYGYNIVLDGKKKLRLDLEEMEAVAEACLRWKLANKKQLKH